MSYKYIERKDFVVVSGYCILTTNRYRPQEKVCMTLNSTRAGLLASATTTPLLARVSVNLLHTDLRKLFF